MPNQCKNKMNKKEDKCFKQGFKQGYQSGLIDKQQEISNWLNHWDGKSDSILGYLINQRMNSLKLNKKKTK